MYALCLQIKHFDSDSKKAEGRAKIREIRSEVETLWDEVQSCLQAKRLRVEKEISRQEKLYMEDVDSFANLESIKESMTAHSDMAIQLQESCSDVALLATMADGKLEDQLKRVAQTTLPKEPAIGKLHIHKCVGVLAKLALDGIADMTDPREVRLFCDFRPFQWYTIHMYIYHKYFNGLSQLLRCL